MSPLPLEFGGLARYGPFRDQERRQRAIASYLMEEMAAVAPATNPTFDCYA